MMNGSVVGSQTTAATANTADSQVIQSPWGLGQATTAERNMQAATKTNEQRQRNSSNNNNNDLG